MTAPRRGLTITAVDVGGRLVLADTPVWILAADADGVTVEYRDRVARVPGSAIIESPVPRPPLERLRELDPCFGLRDDAFEAAVNHEWMFRILRCKAHGRHFIGVMYGGSGMWERVTLLEPGEERNPKAAFDRYIAMSDDWLNLMGRSL